MRMWSLGLLFLLLLPGCSPGYLLLVHEGMDKAEEGAYGEAVYFYTRAMYAGPRTSFLYLRRAEAWAALESNENALQDYDSVLAHDNQNAEAYLGRGTVRLAILSSLSETDVDTVEGVEGMVMRVVLRTLVFADLDRAVHLSPRWAVAIKMRAHAHLVCGNLKEAIADLNAVEWLTWPDAWVLATRARARVLAGDSARALIDFGAAERITPDDGELRFERGLLAYDMGGWSLANEELTHAIQLQPTSPWPWYFRALTRWKLGRRGDACDDACTSAVAGCLPALELAAVFACDFR
jgi:tetratricopeptide (TPR) repeat protein